MALTRDLILQIRAINKASQAINSVKTQIDSLNASIHALNTGAAPASPRGWSDLSKAVEIHNTKIKQADGGLRKIRAAYDSTGKAIKNASKDVVYYNTVIDESAASMENASAKAGLLNGFIKGLGNSARVSAEGFGKMVANNVTWLAGFALIGATIGTVVKLFQDLINRQNEYVKVSRLVATAFENENQRAIANTIAYDEMTNQMARTGRSAADVAEAEYQLLSAGLSLKQTIEGLGPAFNLIDAAQDDVTNTTKLLAGLMSNFGDTMYRTSEGNIVFADSSRAVKEGLRDNVTEFEKMTKISDLLATAFDKHQAELMELRDGLKFSIPAAKAAGVGLDELTATLVTLEDHMIKSGRAGRSLRIMLSSLVKQPELVKQAFKTSFDPAEMDPLVSFLQRAGKEFENMPDKADRLSQAFTRFTSRGADAFTILALNSDELTGNLEELRTKSKGVAEIMAEVARSSPEVQFRRLWNSIVNVVDALGGGGLIKSIATLSGMFATMIQDVADSVNWLERLVLASGKVLGLSRKVKQENKDPLWEFLFCENWRMGFEVIDKWIDKTLEVEDAQAALRSEIESDQEELKDYVANISKAYDQNKLLANSIEAISNVFSALTIGEEVSQGLIDASEGARLLSINLEKASEQGKLDVLNANVQTFRIYMQNTTVTMEQFGKFTQEVINSAAEGFKKAQDSVAQFSRELIDANYKTDQLRISISTLGSENASQLMQLSDSLGLGATSAGQFLDQVNQLEPQIKQLRDEYWKLNAEGAGQEKLLPVWEKLNAAQDQQSKALEKANNALAISLPLIQQRLTATSQTLELNQRFADEQSKIAIDIGRTAEVREQAAQREEKYIEDSIKLLQRQAQDRAKMSEVALKQEEIGEYEHQQNILQIHQETSDRIRALQEQLGSSYERRLEIQIEKEQQTKDKLEESQRVLKEYNTILQDIGSVIYDIDLPKLAEGLRKPFSESVEHLKEVNSQMTTFIDTLDESIQKADELADALARVQSAEAQINTGNLPEAQFGGFFRHSTLAKVTAGEGFVPPSITNKYLPSLKAINQGNSVPANFPIQRFSGPPGIDNILTSLPAGSFVISKRGMDAIDRAGEYRREKHHYQTGGLVSGATSMAPESMVPNEPTSKFELTLVVDGQRNKYPLSGATSVVDELRRTLERENMTRLG